MLLNHCTSLPVWGRPRIGSGRYWAFHGAFAPAKLAAMEVNLRPETASRLQELAQQTGRETNDLIEDAMASYLQELTETREMLNGRYDNLKSGKVKAVDGESAFADLRRKSEQRRAGS
jgi:predicted transcriptional regulator